MKKVIFAAVMLMASFAVAQKAVMVGGQSMFPSKDIVDNAVNSADHTTGIGGESRRPNGYVEEQGAVYGVRPYERGVWNASCWNDRHAG